MRFFWWCNITCLIFRLMKWICLLFAGRQREILWRLSWTFIVMLISWIQFQIRFFLAVLENVLKWRGGQQEKRLLGTVRVSVLCCYNRLLGTVRVSVRCCYNRLVGTVRVSVHCFSNRHTINWLYSFEVISPTCMIQKITVLWDVTLGTTLETYHHFRVVYSPHVLFKRLEVM